MLANSRARRRLRGNGAYPREAEPSGRWRFAIQIEVDRPQLYDLERGFDGSCDVASAAPRRSRVTRRALRTSDETQPQATWREHSGDQRGEASLNLGLVEHMKAAAIKHELVVAVQRIVQEVEHLKT